MSFAAAKQLVQPMPGALSAGDTAALPWEGGTDDSLVKQETWLLSFIDILALLLTLFVLLLAYQDIKPESAAVVEPPATESAQFDLSLFTLLPGETLYGDLGQSGAGLLPLDAGEGYPVAEDTASQPAEPVVIDSADTDTSPAEPADALPAENAPAAEQPQAETQLSESEAVLAQPEPGSVATVAAEESVVPVEFVGPLLPTPAEKIHYAFSQSPLQEHIDLSNRTGAVSVEISDNILFGLASAAVSSEGLKLLKELSAVLGTLPYAVSIEGHTDNVPISSSRFPSNWELSSARAAMATRTLIEQGIAADRLRAIGYGDTRPRADNLTPEGRAKNRRVSFVLHVEETAAE
jgi:chemotaxis protein MotB